MNWKKIRIVMGREFSIRVKKKSFLLTTIFGPILMAALVVLPSILMLSTSGEKQVIAVLDESGLVLPYLEDSEELRFTPVTGSVDSLKAQYATMGVDALVCISALDADRMIAVTSWSDKDLNMEVRSRITRSAERALRDYRMKSYDIENLEAVLQDLDPDISMKAYLFSETGEEKESIVEINMAMSYIASLLIYMFVFMFGNMVMRSVIDEMDDEMFNLYLQYHFAICERSDCVGTSHHILDVFQKE